MSIEGEASASRRFSSSSVNRTYCSFANSKPFTRDVRSTTWLSQAGQTSCCLILPPHFSWSWLKETPPAEAAVYILMGIETSPNERVPEPMECGGISWFLQRDWEEASTAVCYTQLQVLYRSTRPAA